MLTQIRLTGDHVRSHQAVRSEGLDLEPEAAHVLVVVGGTLQIEADGGVGPKGEPGATGAVGAADRRGIAAMQDPREMPEQQDRQARRASAGLQVLLAQRAPQGLPDLLALKVCRALLDRWDRQERRDP